MKQNKDVEDTENCEFCNGSGKVWDSFLGNYVPCETENDCQLSQEETK